MKVKKSVLRVFFMMISIVLPMSVYSIDKDFISQDKDIPTYREISDGIYGGIVPRLELLSGVLSHTQWMNRRGPVGKGNTYFQELYAFFEPYSDHKAIKIARELTSRGFSYDAPPNFILALSPLPELSPRIGYSDYLKQRAGKEEILEEFRLALGELSKESDFMSFYNSHINDYKEWIDGTFQNFNGVAISSWLQDFFGWNGEQFHILLAPAMFPQGGYGATYAMDGELIAVQITREYGNSELQPEFGDGSMLEGLTLHELGHSYVNPTVEANMVFLEEHHFDDFYKPVKEVMQKQAYGNYVTFLNESLLRAVTAVAFSQSNSATDDIQKYNQYQKDKGFYLQDFLTDELLEYKASRDKFSDFKVYLPSLLAKMNREKESLIKANEES